MQDNYKLYIASLITLAVLSIGGLILIYFIGEDRTNACELKGGIFIKGKNRSLCIKSDVVIP